MYTLALSGSPEEPFCTLSWTLACQSMVGEKKTDAPGGRYTQDCLGCAPCFDVRNIWICFVPLDNGEKILIIWGVFLLHYLSIINFLNVKGLRVSHASLFCVSNTFQRHSGWKLFSLRKLFFQFSAAYYTLATLAEFTILFCTNS